MKLRERAIDDLHQMALYEWRQSESMVHRLNRRYRKHVAYLVRVIRRAARRRLRSR